LWEMAANILHGEVSELNGNFAHAAESYAKAAEMFDHAAHHAAQLDDFTTQANCQEAHTRCMDLASAVVAGDGGDGGGGDGAAVGEAQGGDIMDA
jgi:hypothetical protein